MTERRRVIKSFRIDKELWEEIVSLRFKYRYNSLSSFVEDALKYLLEAEKEEIKENRQ